MRTASVPSFVREPARRAHRDCSGNFASRDGNSSRTASALPDVDRGRSLSERLRWSPGHAPKAIPANRIIRTATHSCCLLRCLLGLLHTLLPNRVAEFARSIRTFDISPDPLLVHRENNSLVCIGPPAVLGVRFPARSFNQNATH